MQVPSGCRHTRRAEAVAEATLTAAVDIQVVKRVRFALIASLSRCAFLAFALA